MTESSTVSPATRRKTRRRRSRVIIVAAIVGVIALAGGGVALAATSGSSGDYRTATARQGDVTQVVDAVGTVAAADRYDLSFDVAGEVASVSVSVGDVVESGAVLATLDTESLQEAVDDAQSSLDDAESQLATDQEVQSSSSTPSSSTSSGSSSSSGAASGSTPTGGGTTPSTAAPTTTPTTPGDNGSTDPAVEKAIAAVTTAQEALLAQYETAAASLEVSSDAVTSSGTACQPFLDAAIEESEGSDDGTTPDGTTPDGGEESADEPATDDGTTDDATEDGGTADDGTSGAGTSAIVDALEACQSAIGTVLTNQTTVDEAQSALQERATALDEAVTALRTAVAASSSTPTSSGATSGSGSMPTESTPSGATQSETMPTETAESGSTASATSPTSTGSGVDAAIGGSSTTVTAETLLADAAAITLAEQQLAIAQHQLADNTITAPASGTVAAVSLAAGDDVDAASTTAVITVLADSGYVVETTLPLSDVRAVAIGQTVSVATEGDDADLAATVSSIGVLDVSETSTPSFAVTVSFDDTEVEPLTGTAASLAITAAAASDVLVVPTSAVHVAGTTSTVDVLVDGTVESRQVDLGAVGSDYTEIADGVATGDLVVLADLDQEIASDDTETQTGLTGIGGSSDTQMPGGGFPGGDLPEGFTPPDGFTPGG